jgi:predicted nucleotidyltransferase
VDFRRPLRVIAPTLDGDVLAVLAGGELEVSGRELHRLVGHASEEGVRRAAERLVRQGVVSQQIVGRTRLYKLNGEHLAAAPIRSLVALRAELIQRLRGRVAGWEVRAAAVVLFGSVAKQTATEASDLDLLIVRGRGVSAEHRKWSDQLERLARDATVWTGNDARILEFGELEVLEKRPPVVLEALSDGVDIEKGRQLLRRVKQAVWE